MSDKFITLGKMEQWLEDLEDALKNKVMNTALADKEGREEVYNLYQAAQLLKAQVLSSFSEEVEFNSGRYDSLPQLDITQE